MCLTQLRLIAYMGGLELYFRSSSHHKGFDEDKTTETGRGEPSSSRIIVVCATKKNKQKKQRQFSLFDILEKT